MIYKIRAQWRLRAVYCMYSLPCSVSFLSRPHHCITKASSQSYSSAYSAFYTFLLQCMHSNTPDTRAHCATKFLPYKTLTSQTVTDMSANHSQLESADLLAFFRFVGKLKTIKRTGWVNRKVKEPESVSDHMYRMSMMAMAVGGIDSVRRDRLIKMALVHDLAEAEVGDIAPGDGVSKEEKFTREELAMRHLRDETLSKSSLGKELYDLWLEYDLGKTEDACLVKELDKMEMIVQADEYEVAQEKDLNEFFESTKGVFKTPVMQGLDVALRSERIRRKNSAHVPDQKSE